MTRFMHLHKGSSMKPGGDFRSSCSARSHSMGSAQTKNNLIGSLSYKTTTTRRPFLNSLMPGSPQPLNLLMPIKRFQRTRHIFQPATRFCQPSLKRIEKNILSLSHLRHDRTGFLFTRKVGELWKQ